ncbi:hypothetical protein OOK41_19005 [Micromonospora sp. NBC_01655]|uniref:hypothetical protein n=1 Tax=Micromonospora sp. NBC_01655 TaxID=2975983 RepID=UPI002251713A|nr:hypothetical protein [Micromonospora sp. NBC_01655]MCX4472370.1 hypothetical protein [Micromonospora sp. NBC_01655]
MTCRLARDVGAACPVFPGKRYEDWKPDDPAGKGVAAGRPIRDDIHEGQRGAGRPVAAVGGAITGR